ncbi:EamA family transporter [Novosphingobium panipatense]|uniref:EamA family transporter n=1 Tax=Novosphingobium panipatense TaxID=428991 RepID=UPI00360F9AB6
MTPATAHPLQHAVHRATPYAALAVSITAFCVGTSFGKQLFPAVGASGAIAYRVGFSALFLLALFRPWRASLRRQDLFAVVRYGAVLGLMNLSFYMAIARSPWVWPSRSSSSARSPSRSCTPAAPPISRWSAWRRQALPCFCPCAIHRTRWIRRGSASRFWPAFSGASTSSSARRRYTCPAARRSRWAC